MTGRDPLIETLITVVGDAHVLVDADLRAGFEVDWTGRYRGEARCVVRPGSAVEVAAVLVACRSAHASVVVQGGNTGLVGGGVPRATAAAGDVVLTTTRLDWVGPVDHAAGQLTAGAGATIAAVQHAAASAGLDFGVDWGARDSATVGGAIATDAGGSRVLRFGTMRRQVVGVEVVLPSGEIVSELSGLTKATVGPRLAALVCGAEGIFGIVTAARLALVPQFAERLAAWIVVDSVGAAVELLTRLRRVDQLDAVEILLPSAVRIVADEFELEPPWPVPAGGAAVLADFAGDRDLTDDIAELLDGLGVRGGLASGPRREHLMAIRDHVSMAIGRRGVPLKLDVAVPIDRLAELVAVAQRAADDAEAILYAFGHLAEGNLHLNYHDVGDPAQLTDRVLGWVIDAGGTISAEHGIGRAKASWLTRARGDAVDRLLRSIKASLDPDGVLNPGVLLPAVSPPRPHPDQPRPDRPW